MDWDYVILGDDEGESRPQKGFAQDYVILRRPRAPLAPYTTPSNSQSVSEKTITRVYGHLDVRQVAGLQPLVPVTGLGSVGRRSPSVVV